MGPEITPPQRAALASVARGNTAEHWLRRYDVRLPTLRALERRGLLRSAEYCWHLTDAGRATLAAQIVKET